MIKSASSPQQQPVVVGAHRFPVWARCQGYCLLRRARPIHATSTRDASSTHVRTHWLLSLAPFAFVSFLLFLSPLVRQQRYFFLRIVNKETTVHT